MVLRSGMKFAEWLGALVAGLALVAGVGFWILSSGPLSLDWLAPYVATVFAKAEPGLTARIDHTLVKLGEGPRLEIVAQGLHISRGEGEDELTLPDVSLAFSPRRWRAERSRRPGSASYIRNCICCARPTARSISV